MSKVWFVTGCSKGFGREIVENVLRTPNNKVVATARNPETLLDLERQYGERILCLKLDIQNKADIENGVKEALKTFSKIDVLVNNAGYGLGGAIEECSMGDIRDIFETNVFGLIALTKEVLPHMRQQKSGQIINISSVAGLIAMPGAGIYNATKFAVEGLTEALAQEVGVFGIKVTSIEPGPFRTDFTGNSLVMSSEIKDYENSPVAQSRMYLKEIHGQQPGDPKKAAEIIIQVTNMENPPLRLPLGNPALDRIHDKIEKWTQEVSKFEELSRSADYVQTSSENVA